MNDFMFSWEPAWPRPLLARPALATVFQRNHSQSPHGQNRLVRIIALPRSSYPTCVATVATPLSLSNRTSSRSRASTAPSAAHLPELMLNVQGGIDGDHNGNLTWCGALPDDESANRHHINDLQQ